MTVATRPAEFGSFAGTHAAVPAGRRARALRRVAGLAAWTGMCYAAWLALAIAGRLSRRARAARRPLVRRWARGALRALGVRLDVRGPVPAAPFVLVSNHLGYLDIAVLGAVVEGVFVAKADVRGWPALGHLAQAVGTEFVDRASPRDALRTAGRLAARWAAGEGIVLFPEATSSDGAGILPLRPALLDWAARGGVGVRAATITYSTAPGEPPAREAVCWWGGMEFVPHLLGLCRLDGVVATVTFADRPVTAPDRRTLAAQLHAVLRRHFTPVDSKEAA